MGSDESHFNVSVRTRQGQQTTTCVVLWLDKGDYPAVFSPNK